MFCLDSPNTSFADSFTSAACVCSIFSTPLRSLVISLATISLSLSFVYCSAVNVAISSTNALAV